MLARAARSGLEIDGLQQRFLHGADWHGGVLIDGISQGVMDVRARPEIYPFTPEHRGIPQRGVRHAHLLTTRQAA